MTTKSQSQLIHLMFELAELSGQAADAFNNILSFIDSEGINIQGDQFKVTGAKPQLLLDGAEAVIRKASEKAGEVRLLCWQESLAIPDIVPGIEAMVLRSLKYIEKTRATRFHTH